MTINQDNDNQPGMLQRRSQRQIVDPDRIKALTGDWWEYASVSVSKDYEPKSLNEEVKSKDSKFWKEAADK